MLQCKKRTVTFRSMTPAEQTFTLLEESQGHVQMNTWCLSRTGRLMAQEA